MKKFLVIALIFAASFCPAQSWVQSSPDYVGDSTDTKPTLAASNAGSTFLEINTGYVYMWDGDGWEFTHPDITPVFSMRVEQMMDSLGDGTGILEQVITGKTVTAAAATTPNLITAASHGYSTGSWVYLHEVAAGYNGLWQVVGVPTVNTFQTSGSIGGSVGGLAAFLGTADSFQAFVVTPPAGQEYHLSRMNIFATDSLFRVDRYMNQTALTSGIIVIIQNASREVTTITATPVKTFAQWGLNSGPVDATQLVAASDAVGGVRWSFFKGAGQIMLHGDLGEVLAIIVRDDLTVDSQQASIQGYAIND